MLHPSQPGLHTPQINTAYRTYPEAVLISGLTFVLQHQGLERELSLLPFPFLVAAETLSVHGLGPASLYMVLYLVSNKDLKVDLSGHTRIVTSVEYKIGAFEVALAS